MRQLTSPQLSAAATTPRAAVSICAAIFAAVALLTSCSSDTSSQAPHADNSPTASAKPSQSEVERLKVKIVDKHAFDPTSFTQGLEVAPDGTLYVGTGQEGESRIYRTTIDGRELATAALDPEFFGEGITRIDDTLWQLTWQNNVAIKRDATTLEEIARADFEGEGWGLCSLGNDVIFSDGTSQLRRMDPETLEERSRFDVTLNGEPVNDLNELECVGGDIYANIFTTTNIVRIDAATGTVTAVIDASDVPNRATPDPNNVLNGIAHIPGTDEFFITGKRWPDLYRVTFVPS
ncbi:glutaminyl-peptide cyclotransferase [Corynebacterium aquatimens]|uniref:Glutamine cyclotransferase n=1 Tax=Corynebacterium aquatimens TaxID=1190508 RepID=A0A931DYJ2_9CORY|nr:glutaminyl-peptide cyclotransferase [Corynebacterium aquatimens]MBG6121043.1 glutamine cyclotransferase [Corynebacterium aquatimens]WJY66400.1 Glutamine cyclotransferase [Corynebacterium aquatimens]